MSLPPTPASGPYRWRPSRPPRQAEGRPWFLLLLATLLLAGCEQPGRILGSLPPPGTRVHLVRARRGDLTQAVTLRGNLRALRRASVSGGMAGVIARVAVREGDRVAAGQTLLVLDARALEAQVAEQEGTVEGARARVRQVESEVAQARLKYRADLRQAEEAWRQARYGQEQARIQESANAADLRRLHDLVQEGAIPATQEDQARERWQVSHQQHLVARSRARAAGEALRAARAGSHAIVSQEEQLAGARASLQQALATLGARRLDVERSVVRAPIAGVVVSVGAEPGQSTGVGSAPLFVIVDNGRLELVTAVDQKLVGQLQRGMEADLIPLAASPGPASRARLLGVVPATDPKTRSARVLFDVSGARGLMDGLAVEARVIIGRQSGLLVPRAALGHEGAHAYVVAIIAGVAHRRVVEAGLENETNVVVTKGLEDGEPVAADGIEDLHDGDRVQPPAGSAGSPPPEGGR